MRLGRDQHLAAEMAALLFRGELILIMDPRGARGDIGLHDLETVERPAEAGLGIGDDRREPIAREGAFLMLALVGALERVKAGACRVGKGVCMTFRLWWLS